MLTKTGDQEPGRVCRDVTQESCSKNHKLMEERGDQHAGNPAEMRDWKKSILHLIQRAGSQRERGPEVENKGGQLGRERTSLEAAKARWSRMEALWWECFLSGGLKGSHPQSPEWVGPREVHLWRSACIRGHMEGTKTHWFSGGYGRAIDFGGVKYESVMLAVLVSCKRSDAWK